MCFPSHPGPRTGDLVLLFTCGVLPVPTAPPRRRGRATGLSRPGRPGTSAPPPSSSVLPRRQPGPCGATGLSSGPAAAPRCPCPRPSAGRRAAPLVAPRTPAWEPAGPRRAPERRAAGPAWLGPSWDAGPQVTAQHGPSAAISHRWHLQGWAQGQSQQPMVTHHPATISHEPEATQLPPPFYRWGA